MVGITLGMIALFLVFQSILGEYILTNVLHNPDSVPALLFDLFSVNAEQTIPTWYSVALLLLAAVLLALIARSKGTTKDSYTLYWLGLAVLFLYLSIDEGAVIHEIAADALHVSFNTTGFLYFGWQIIAVPIVVIIAILYLRFVFHLPSRIRNLFILAALLYVGGALVVEGISANQFYADGAQTTVVYLAIGTLEEFCEMLGVIVLIYTLLTYISQMGYQYTFSSTSALPSARNPNSFIEEAVTQPPFQVAILPRVRPFLPRIGLAIIMIAGFNFILFVWAQSQDTTVIRSDSSVPIYQAIVDQLTSAGTIVSQMQGMFGSNNPAADQYAASLLALFDNVMVISFPASETSIYIAGDQLLFDQNALIQLLHTQGENQFILFDTPTVRALTG